MGALDFIIFCPQRSTLTCPVRKPHASPIVKTANSAWNWQTLYVPPNHVRTYVLYSAAMLLSWLPVVEVGCARIHSMANAAPLSCVQFRNSLSLKLRKHSPNWRCRVHRSCTMPHAYGRATAPAKLSSTTIIPTVINLMLQCNYAHELLEKAAGSFPCDWLRACIVAKG